MKGRDREWSIQRGERYRERKCNREGGREREGQKKREREQKRKRRRKRESGTDSVGGVAGC